jgi:hypothetical protein
MLSSRRGWCGLAICVLLGAVMLIEPLHQFVLRWAISHASGNIVTTARVQFHRQREVLEIEELSASQTDEICQVQVRAQRAFIKLDMPSLLDQRVNSPKVKLQGVRIELASLERSGASANGLPTTPVTETWQSVLDGLLTALQWESVREGLESLVAADEALDGLDSKMKGWLLRSQQIMFHADQLTQSIQSFSNPLRHVQEIRSQLNQLEQLRIEQENLHKHFAGINDALTEHLQVLSATSERDVAALRANSDRGVAHLRAQAAEQMVQEWSKQLLTQQLMLGQAVAVLFQDPPQNCPYNVDVRDISRGNLPIAISGIEAEGVLVDTLRDVPFAALGEFALKPRSDNRFAPRAAWRIQCQAESLATRFDIESETEGGGWRLQSTSTACAQAPASPSDMVRASMATSTVPEAPEMFTLDASICNSQVRGQAKMNLAFAEAFAKLPCASNADLEPLATATTDASTPVDPTAATSPWIEFRLSGCATQPQVTLDSELPSHFIESITDRIHRRLQNHQIASEEQLAAAIASKTDELKSRVETGAKQGLQTVAKQQEILADMHLRLEQTLQARESYEYARLPTKPTATR